METDFTKEAQPVWCKNCDKQGWYFHDDPEAPVLLSCTGCGFEFSSVWCPWCRERNDIVEALPARPTSWTCSICGGIYPLPESFYTQPLPLYTEDTLPLGQRSQLIPEDRKVEHADPPPALPASLVIVSVIFILSGALSVFDMLVKLSHNQLFLNLGVLGLLIGPGLLRRRPGWRVVALVWVLLCLTGTIIAAVLISRLNEASSVHFAAVVAVFLFYLWQFYVLLRRDVSRMFACSPEKSTASENLPTDRHDAHS